MAIFRAYAAVLEPDDPAMRIYEAGLRTCPGRPGLLLADVLRRTGGVYETTTPLSPRLRDDIREAAELTSDPELSAIADLAEVPVSLDHLRGLDPQTRIIIRAELSYHGDEGARVSRARQQQPAVATIMPDGTVIAGNAMPGLQSRHDHEPGSQLSARVTGPPAARRIHAQFPPKVSGVVADDAPGARSARAADGLEPVQVSRADTWSNCGGPLDR
jgi:hypothetical protein